MVLNISGLTNAYIKGAKDNGAEVVENCPVENILVESGRVCGIETAKNGTVM